MPPQVRDSYKNYIWWFLRLDIVDETIYARIYTMFVAFRNHGTYMRSIRTNTTKAHNFLTERFFRPGNRQLLNEIDGMTGPLRKLRDPDIEVAAVIEEVLPHMAGIWKTMHSILFEGEVIKDVSDQRLKMFMATVRLVVPGHLAAALATYGEGEGEVGGEVGGGGEVRGGGEVGVGAEAEVEEEAEEEKEDEKEKDEGKGDEDKEAAE